MANTQQQRTADELTSLSLTQAARLIRQGDLSPLELTAAFLERIQRLDSTYSAAKLNCFITVTAEAALEQARQAEAQMQRAAGSPLGALHGLPLALKDLFDLVGTPTTAGAQFFRDYRPVADAAVVQKLAAAGAIFLGKTNMHEIALGLTTVNPHYGACHNPWGWDHVTGGSSGGSAAALAARLCPGALGSDTGGSIRVPAALCGVVGLKPTYGRVSLRGVTPLSWNLDHAGPMARRVEDVALLLQVIAGYDPDDPASVNIPVDDYCAALEQGVRGWKIALADDEYFEPTRPEVWSAVRQAARVFEELGAQVQATPFPGARQAALANGLMVVSDAAVYHQERLAGAPERFGADVLERLRKGAQTPLTDYVQARRTQIVLRRQFERFFEQYDLLLLPTTPVTAPPIAGPDAIELARLLTRYTAPFNLTGLPALSVPCGFAPDGLPVGLQLVAAPWAETRLLRAAYAYEQAAPWFERTPKL